MMFYYILSVFLIIMSKQYKGLYDGIDLFVTSASSVRLFTFYLRKCCFVISPLLISKLKILLQCFILVYNIGLFGLLFALSLLKLLSTQHKFVFRLLIRVLMIKILIIPHIVYQYLLRASPLLCPATIIFYFSFFLVLQILPYKSLLQPQRNYDNL